MAKGKHGGYLSQSAKAHYQGRPDSERAITMKTWCREIHSGCEVCQGWITSKKG